MSYPVLQSPFHSLVLSNAHTELLVHWSCLSEPLGSTQRPCCIRRSRPCRGSLFLLGRFPGGCPTVRRIVLGFHLPPLPLAVVSVGVSIRHFRFPLVVSGVGLLGLLLLLLLVLLAGGVEIPPQVAAQDGSEWLVLTHCFHHAALVLLLAQSSTALFPIRQSKIQRNAPADPQITEWKDVRLLQVEHEEDVACPWSNALDLEKARSHVLLPVIIIVAIVVTVTFVATSAILSRR
mmetsp:Transcript_15889/g.43897  ORF Transcript_15889/g.43897 Transcript_15889/m.43897 type:complete len:234 (+) Transcript_15889:93-794(+)